MNIGEYIDAVSYNGHAIRQFMNRKIEEDMRAAAILHSKI